ncbi:MAG: DNA ligase [Synergistetes bacterium ADurb.BinA166]|nr:MAG: DNA ligase [Synergistetes bacterium ADurb.BinA166]
MAKVSELTPLADVIQVMECGGALKGKVFSITGHLARKRSEIVKIIEQAGGSFEERPRFGVHFLITNKSWNAGSTVSDKASSKLLEAQRNGIKIISESRFYDIIMSSDALKETGS